MKNAQSCGWLAILPIVALLSLPLPVLGAEGDEGVSFQGAAAIGGHVSDVKDEAGRVREYDLAREVYEPDLWLDLFRRVGDDALEFLVDYHDEETLGFKGRIDAGPNVCVRVDHRSFHHRFDHDRLENLLWKEWVGVDSLGNDLGGGKMVTSEDTDPMGRYGVRYTDTKERVEIDLPFIPGTTISSGYRDQRRHGIRQGIGVDHCANCHVRSQRSYLDEQTRDFTLGVSAEASVFAASYKFSGRDFNNEAAAPVNQYMEARHPVTGLMTDEFGSRLLYDDENLAFSQAPDAEKRAHAVQARVDMPGSQSLRGAFSYAETKNVGLKPDYANRMPRLTANSASLAWFAPFGEKVRATAGLVRRDISGENILLDFPSWREGGTGGGQNFDWLRRSAYDREEYVGTASVNWMVKPGQNLRVNYRLRSTDRENVILDPEDPSSTKTLQNRVRVSWNGRLSPGTRSRAWVEYEMTDSPFVNATGICESPATAEDPLSGNSQYFYFQRERIGTGGNLPTQAIRGNANLSYGFGARGSLTGYVSLASEKNDDLNLYEFERTVISPGLSALWFPTQTVAITGGGSFSIIESNAKICATVMDG